LRVYAQTNRNTVFSAEWYKGTIASVNPDADTFDVEYDDGEMDEGLGRHCVRAYKPLEVGELAAVRNEDMVFYDGRVVEVHADGTVDIDTPVFGLFEDVSLLDVRRFDPPGEIKEGSRIEALFQGEGEDWWPGVVLQVNDDRTYDIEYDDGDTELGVEPEDIREAPY
jgi:hypothetical protein